MGEEPLGLHPPDKLKFAVPELMLRQAILTIYITLPFGKVMALCSLSTGPRHSRIIYNFVVAKCHVRIGLRGASGAAYKGAQRQYN